MGTELWTKAITEEMENVCIEFEDPGGVSPDDTRKGKIRPGYEHVNVHMIFEINMDGNFTRKEIFVADGHITDPPSLTP